MSGQRIDREDRYELTGLTAQARIELVAKLRSQGLSERAIAKKLGVAPSNVHYILKELAGKPRTQERMGMCEGDGEQYPISQLNDVFLCPRCQRLADDLH